MKSFEELRRRGFETHAARALEIIDPETGLMPEKRPVAGCGARFSGGNVKTTNAAALSLAMTGREALAWKMLGVVLDNQDTDPASMTRGNFRKCTGWDFVGDPNDLTFMVPVLWYLYRRRAAAMPPPLRRRLEDAFRLAVPALEAHRGAHLSYTNIILLNLAARLCLADILDLPRVRALAGWEWEEWRNYILRLGFLPEYSAPGYTRVQLHALSIILACPAPEGLHGEARNFLRHIVSEAVLNYHERIGLFAGPQSRGHYAVRGRFSMEWVVRLVLGLPAEPGVWLGAAISQDDLLPEARERRLPRLNRVFSPSGFERTSWLAPGYALGSVNSRNRVSNPETPFFLAWVSADPYCGLPFVPREDPAGFCARQERGRLLAAGTWLLARRDPGPLAGDPVGRFSHLKTGAPGNIVSRPDSRPGFTLPLGPPGLISVRAGDDRQPVTGGRRRLTGGGLVLETESIFAGLRFFGPGTGDPALKLKSSPDGVFLEVSASRKGIVLNGLERAVFCGFCLDIAPRRGRRRAPPALIPSLSGLKRTPLGWRAGASFRGGRSLDLDIDLRPASFYEAGGRAVTPNLLYFDGA